MQNISHAILDVKKAFKVVLATEIILLASKNTDNYFVIQEKLKAQLVNVISLDFGELNGRDLLKLCALVSTHRPVAPHSFLVKCSMLSDIKDMSENIANKF